MYEINSAPAEMRQIQFASAPHEIVRYDYAIAATLKMKGKLSANESASASNQNLQGVFASLESCEERVPARVSR
jgi:hypothetical protein